MIYAVIVLAVLVAGLVIAMAVVFSRLVQVEKRAERHSKLLHGNIVPKLQEFEKDLEPMRRKALQRRSRLSGVERH